MLVYHWADPSARWGLCGVLAAVCFRSALIRELLLHRKRWWSMQMSRGQNTLGFPLSVALPSAVIEKLIPEKIPNAVLYMQHMQAICLLNLMVC